MRAARHFTNSTVMAWEKISRIDNFVGRLDNMPEEIAHKSRTAYTILTVLDFILTAIKLFENKYRYPK